MKAPVLPRPFPHEHLEAWTDEQWRTIPAEDVPIATLIPSQEAVTFEVLSRLLRGEQPQTRDFGRAVRWRGELFLFDGHHRWVIALLAGLPTFSVRIVDV